MNADIDSFLEAGLQHYPAALHAVSAFEEQLQQQLEAAMADQDGDSCVGLAKEPKYRASRGGADAWRFFALFGDISADAAGVSSGRLELGLWWHPPFDPNGSSPYAAAGVSGGSWPKQFSSAPGSPGRIQKSGGYSYLYLPVEAPAALGDVLRRLLGELDRALKACRQGGT